MKEEGYVYVASNPCMPGVVKIGKTTKHPRERLRDLQGTGVPVPFVAEYFLRVRDCDQLERRIHRVLKSYRVNERREFFTIDVATAVKWIENAASADRQPGFLFGDGRIAGRLRRNSHSHEVQKNEPSYRSAALGGLLVWGGLVFTLLFNLG